MVPRSRARSRIRISGRSSRIRGTTEGFLIVVLYFSVIYQFPTWFMRCSLLYSHLWAGNEAPTPLIAGPDELIIDIDGFFFLVPGEIKSRFDGHFTCKDIKQTKSTLINRPPHLKKYNAGRESGDKCLLSRTSINWFDKCAHCCPLPRETRKSGPYRNRSDGFGRPLFGPLIAFTRTVASDFRCDVHPQRIRLAVMTVAANKNAWNVSYMNGSSLLKLGWIVFLLCPF